MGWSEKYKKSIDCNNPKGFSQKAHCAGRKKKNEDMVFEEITEDILNEKLITYGNRKPYGQVVFMAGGAGSGKGFAIKNFVDSASFKIRDVDEMKKQLQILNRLGKIDIKGILQKYGRNIKLKDLDLIRKIQKDGYKLKNLNLKNPDHVYALHILVKAMGIKDNTLEKLLLGKENPETLPNILFDITAKDVTDITSVIPKLKEVGYKPENIHLTWILTSYITAMVNNKNRSRMVPEDILLKTHEGAANTVWGLVTKALPKGMNGRVDVILNNPEHTVFYTDADGKTISGGVKGFLSLPLKKEKGGIFPEKVWKEKLFGWVKQNAPDSITANMEESVNEGADYKYLTQVILDAKPKYNVSYNHSNNVVNIGGVGYDKGELVKQFNQKPGSSSDIKANFFHANKDPQKTKREVEKLSNGKIKVTIGKGYGNEPIVYYSLKESIDEARRSVVYKAAKKGSFPVSLVVVKNGKVIDQELVNTPEAVPAAFNVIQSKHKSATIHIEDKTGKRLFSEAYKGNISDFKYEFPNTFEDETGNSTKAIKKVSKKGKGYEVRTSTYMSEPEMKKVGDALGLKLVNYQKSGNVAITLYESVNEGPDKIQKFDDVHIKSKNLTGMVYSIKGKDVVVKTLKKGLVKAKMDDLTKLYTDGVNEAMKPSQVRSAISKVKKQLMRKWKQKGGYENFGQKELSQMKDRFDYNPYGSSDEREIAKMLDGFDNWAMNYDGNMREALEEKVNLFFEENCPTDAGKWSYYKGQAKKKFDVYPSAYANGWAAKQYKAAGGGWKKCK